MLIQAVVSLVLRQSPVLVGFCETTYFILLVLATGAALRNAIRTRRAIRLFWSFLAAGFGLWALVPCSWFNSVVLHGKLPAYIFENLPLFLHTVLLIAAIVARPHLLSPSRRPYRATLNFLILLFVWVFAYAFLLFPYNYGAEGSIMILRFEGIYLAENILLLWLLGWFAFRSTYPWKSIYLNLFGASALYTLGSLVANLVWALKDPAGDLATHPAARGLIGMVFTASIFWFFCIGLKGARLTAQLTHTVQLDTKEPRYSSAVAMLAVVAIPLVGVWELVYTNETPRTHGIRLLLVLGAGVLLAAGAFAQDYLSNREFVSDVAAAHDRLRLAMESAKSMGWDWDLISGKTVWFGDLETAFGITANTYLPGEDEYFRRLHPDDRERVTKGLYDAIQQQTPYVAEYRVLRPDGSVRWLTDRGNFYYANDGRPLRGLGVGVDITDQREAEEARRQKEAELEKTEQLAQVGAWQWEQDSQVVTWSEELYRIAGLDPLLPAPGYEQQSKLYTPESWARLQYAVKTAIREGSSYELDLEMIRPDGTTRWLIGRGEVRLDGAGRLIQLHGTVQDITERKQAEIAVRESEERFRLVSNTAPVLIWMAGTDKLCTFFNKGWLDFTGRPLSAELGNGWAEGVHSEDFERCLETYVRAFDLRREFRMEYRLRDFSGTYRWLLDIGVPRFNSDGSFAGYIGSCIDVTERRLAEVALSNMSSRLIDAQEQERTRIARDLHDDISQRLALIVIELDVLKKKILVSNLDAQDRVDRLHKYTSEVAFDIQALSHELHSPRLEYLGVVAAMKGCCQEFAEKHEFEVDFSSHDVPAAVPADISLCLFRVLQEALHNGAKHSGSLRFDVRLWGTPGEVRLTVTDAGVGFDSAQAVKGSGLGLISMRERVRLINGTISIASQIMQGTEITVRVPFRVASPMIQSANLSPRQAGQTTTLS